MISHQIRERYLRDPLPIRLGGLAADLARIVSFAENPTNHRVVASLLEESKYFAEWTAFDAPLEIQALLAEVQLWAALQELDWVPARSTETLRQEAQRWSDQLLSISGLV